MISTGSWYDRSWTFDLPIHAFPSVIERLRGTPILAADLVSGLAEDVLGERVGGRWSAKDHLGHLDDLSELDERRVREFLDGALVLSSADPANGATERANHATRPASEIVAGLGVRRARLVQRLEGLVDDDVGRTSQHPRLRRSMRLIDWAFFVAEHDDHHLAKARECVSSR